MLQKKATTFLGAPVIAISWLGLFTGNDQYRTIFCGDTLIISRFSYTALLELAKNYTSSSEFGYVFYIG